MGIGPAASSCNAGRFLIFMKASMLLPFVVGVLALAKAQARQQDQGFWSNIGSGDWAGRMGIHTLDHAEGRDLIIGQGFGYSPSCWRAFRHDPATGAYQQVFAKPPTLRSYSYVNLSTVTVGDVDPRPGEEVIVGTLTTGQSGAGRVEIYDGTTKELIRTFRTSDGTQDVGLTSLLVHDVDGDGVDEILVNHGSLYVMRGDGSFLWSCPSAGERVVIGQLDDDPAMELAGSEGEVVDLGQRSKQWSTEERMFWSDVLIHDVDGDGVGELIAFKKWGGVYAINIRTGQELWRYERSGGISAVLADDIDGDGLQELVVGDAQWGGLHVLRLGAGAPVELYQINEPGYDPETMWTSSGTTALHLADPDSDGRKELVWCYGGDGDTAGPSQIFIYDPVARAFEWISPWRASPNGIPKIGDVTGDGKPELITSAGVDILVYDLETLSLLNPPKQVAERLDYFAGGLTLGLHDVDDDGCMEIAVAGRYELRILKFQEGVGFDEIWRSADPALSRDEDYEREHASGFESMAVRDVDADGDLEVIVTTRGMSWRDFPDFIQIFDYETGRREWVSGDLLPNVDTWLNSRSVVSSLIKDTDGDGHLEIVVVMSYGHLIILDLATRELEVYDDQASYSMMADSPGGESFYVLEATGPLHEVKSGPDGYEAHFLKTLGSMAADVRAFAPAPQDRWWVIIKSQVALVAPDNSWDWSSVSMEQVWGGFAFHESTRGPEFFIGWLYGITGFKTGHLFAKPEIRVDTMVTPAESGRLGYVNFIRGDTGVGLSHVRFTLAGTAKLGEDFTMAGAFDEDGDGIWEFPLPDMYDRGVTFYPVADSLSEGDETVVMQLLDDPSLVYSKPGPVEFVIEDDEPRLSVSVLKGEASESAKGVLEFLVERTGDVSVPLAANFRISGTAGSQDFTTTDRALQFKAGVSSLKLRFAAKADKLAEVAESVTVELAGGSAAWVNPAAASATGWILDGQSTVRLVGANPVRGGVEVVLGSEGTSTSRTAVKLQIDAVFADGKTTRKVVTANVGPGGEAGRYFVKSGKSAAQVAVTLLEGPAYHRAGGAQVEFTVPALIR